MAAMQYSFLKLKEEGWEEKERVIKKLRQRQKERKNLERNIYIFGSGLGSADFENVKGWFLKDFSRLSSPGF